MYSVVIVDDEMLIRIGMKTLIDWNMYNLVLVGEADNGVNAIDIVKQTNADIVITDIKMPEMDGLDMISRLKADGYSGKFIILSNYDDFNLVKKALKLGASDYLLKLTMKKEDLDKVFQNIINEINDYRDKENKVNIVLTNLKENRDLIKSRYFKDLIEKREELSYFQEKTFFFNINTDFEKFYLIYFKIDNESSEPGETKDRSLMISSTQNIAKEIFEKKLKGEIFSFNDNEFIGIVPEIYKHDDFMYATIELSDLVKLYLNITISIVYSRGNRFPEDISNAYELSRTAFKLQFYYGCKSIIEAGKEKLKSLNETLQNSDLYNNIRNMPESDDMDKLEVDMNRLFSQFRENLIDPDDVKTEIEKLIILIEEKYNVSHKFELNPDFNATLKEIGYSCTIDELNKTVIKYLEIKKGKDEGIKSQKHTRAISETIKHIERNYNKDINIKDISDMLKFNYSYFCRLFKQEMGMTITDYIIQYRIDKAKEFLKDPNIRISEASYLAGFNDQFHFSKTFKKIVGMSPKDYKNKS